MNSPVSAIDVLSYPQTLGEKARNASRAMVSLTGNKKNNWLLHGADDLEKRNVEILEANSMDLQAASQYGLSAAQVDRLRLTPTRIASMASGMRAVASLPDPVGRILDSSVRPNGLLVCKVGVPLGVIFFIYESRPNVTVDAAALCIKSGNAVILRGGKEALNSNLALYRILRECLVKEDLPADALQLVETIDREVVSQLLQSNHCIDLVIPRGGEGLIRKVAAEATMPVLKHYLGNCHIYVDEAADLDMAERIVINGKCQRPGVCNATESLLVHRAIAQLFLSRIGPALQERGVLLKGCSETRGVIPDIEPASEEDYAAEFLDLILSIKVVGDVEEAIDHITRYGSGHTEAIITSSLPVSRRFTSAVDAAAVMVNASTRFHDGFEFGLGAEIGISTDKFHARGPCGLVELCSYKFIVHGDGQIKV